MDITKRVRHDHAEIRSLSQRILSSMEGDDAGSRDTNFALYDKEVRRHLEAFEDVFIARMAKDQAAADAANDIADEHRAIRKSLRKLNRRHKDTAEWTEEFRSLSERFESLCHRHEALVARTVTVHDNAQLDYDYEQVKLSAMQGRSGWTKALIALGATGALAGAAYLANRYGATERVKGLADRLPMGGSTSKGKSKSKSAGSETDVVIIESEIVEVVPVPVPVPVETGASKPTRTTGTAGSGSSTAGKRAGNEHVSELTGSSSPSTDYNASSSFAQAESTRR